MRFKGIQLGYRWNGQEIEHVVVAELETGGYFVLQACQGNLQTMEDVKRWCYVESTPQDALLRKISEANEEIAKQQEAIARMEAVRASLEGQ